MRTHSEERIKRAFLGMRCNDAAGCVGSNGRCDTINTRKEGGAPTGGHKGQVRRAAWDVKMKFRAVVCKHAQIFCGRSVKQSSPLFEYSQKFQTACS